MKATPATPSMIAREQLVRALANKDPTVEFTERGQMLLTGKNPGQIPVPTVWILTWCNNDGR